MYQTDSEIEFGDAEIAGDIIRVIPAVSRRLVHKMVVAAQFGFAPLAGLPYIVVNESELGVGSSDVEAIGAFARRSVVPPAGNCRNHQTRRHQRLPLATFFHSGQEKTHRHGEPNPDHRLRCECDVWRKQR